MSTMNYGNPSYPLTRKWCGDTLKRASHKLGNSLSKVIK